MTRGQQMAAAATTAVGLLVGISTLHARNLLPTFDYQLRPLLTHEEEGGCRFCVDDCVDDSAGIRTSEECLKRCKERGKCPP